MGTRLRISAPGLGACIGTIEDIRAIDDLPDLPGFTEAGFSAREILREWHVTRHALISYSPAPGVELMFSAVEIEGAWYDLRRQPLALEVIGQSSVTTTT